MKSELFIECAKNVVDIYNSIQESIGSKDRMEYPKVIEEKKPREWHISEANLNHFDNLYHKDYYPEINYIKVREVIE